MEKNWTREAIVDLIISIERKIQPEKFQVDGITVWPWVRVKLFFFLLHSLERVELDKSPKVPTGLAAKAKLLIHSLKHWLKFSRSEKKDILFVAAASHRASLSGVSYNKFFDPFRSIQDVASRSVMMEYSKNTNNSFDPASIYSFTDLLHAARIFNRGTNNQQHVWSDIIAAVKPVIEEQGLQNINLTVLQKRLAVRWAQVSRSMTVWERVLNHTHPKLIFTLCYYSDVVYALNVVASRRGIPTFEMQHGPINKYHLAYGSYSHMPAISASPLLPKQFLVWDQSSQQTLESSFPDKKTRVAGQPWIDFIDNKYSGHPKASKNIVYALQPVSEIGDQFPSFMVNWIKASAGEYQWRLRLHPRQFHERPQIEEQLKRLLPGIQFDIDKASADPLPVVLKNADLVITNFSGVVLEAGFMGVPSIAIHAIARLYFINEHNAHLTYVCDEADRNLGWNEIRAKALSHIKNQISRVDSISVFNEII